MSAGDSQRVCFVAPWRADPAGHRGLDATELAYAASARTLAAAGHAVTVLVLPNGDGAGARDAGAFRGERIELVDLPPWSLAPLQAPALAVIAYRVFCWLRARTFDVVHFPEAGGVGFYATLAKRQGLALGETTLCVGIQGPTLWRREMDAEHVQLLSDLEADFCERSSVALADVLWSAGEEIPAWMERSGWGLPARRTASPGLVAPAGPEVGTGRPHPPRQSALPRVSVCLTHFNRAAELPHAVASLRAQDYPEIEVVLVDDGSTEPAALAVLAGLEPEFASRGWRIVRQENRYLGAARNTAVRHARGEYLLFMDDDNLAKPGAVRTFVAAALATDADVLTCFADVTAERGEPGRVPPRERRLYLGGAAAVGAFYNCFGDANALVHRRVFDAVGGFTEDRGIGHEDWELFARAVLMGFRLEVVPEALYWYRVDPHTMAQATSQVANYRRSLRPYLDAVPRSLRGLVTLAQGVKFRSDAMEKFVRTHESARFHARDEWGLLVEAAKLLAARGEADTAEAVLQAALHMVGTNEDRQVVSRTLREVGTALLGIGRRETAVAVLLTAVELAERCGDFAAVALGLLEAGKVFADLGQVDKARSTMLNAVRAARQTEHAPLIYESLMGAGNALAGLGDAEEARQIVTTAQTVARQHLDIGAMQRADALLRTVAGASAGG
jgi:glycosyltransferase involved in cell wall biosynthesis